MLMNMHFLDSIIDTFKTEILTILSNALKSLKRKEKTL